MYSSQNVGKHCADPTCKQLDFLPFTCTNCSKTFCLDHRDPVSHNCELANLGDKKVMLCPFCQKTIYYQVGKELEIDVLTRHSTTDCNPQMNGKHIANNLNVCPVKGCKVKLTELNKYECKKCGKKVCLKHRFEEDHECLKGISSTNKENRKIIDPINTVNNKQRPIDQEPKRDKKKKNLFEKVISKLTCGGCGTKKKASKKSNNL